VCVLSRMQQWKNLWNNWGPRDTHSPASSSARAVSTAKQITLRYHSAVPVASLRLWSLFSFVSGYSNPAPLRHFYSFIRACARCRQPKEQCGLARFFSCSGWHWWVDFEAVSLLRASLIQNFRQKGLPPPIIFAWIVRPMNAL